MGIGAVAYTFLLVLHLASAGMFLSCLLIAEFVLSNEPRARLKLIRLAQWVLGLLLVSGLGLLGFRFMEWGGTHWSGFLLHPVGLKFFVLLLLGGLSGLQQRRLKRAEKGSREKGITTMSIVMAALVLASMVVGVLIP